ncbi:MAG: tetratricopeptide repeat protein [Bacteroidales bacterium]|nr:tetratricopeptide repeat protein [Bacteroidales bacterium]
MRVLLRMGLKTLTALFILGISVSISAQTEMAEVADAFNQGVQMMKINPDMAIKSFETAIELADQVEGEEAAELKNQAMKQIPKMYWESAKKLAGKKDYDNAITKLDACIETSKKVGDKSQASRAFGTALSILNVQGSTALGKGDHAAALEYFDKALERRASYAKAYLGKVLVYEEMGDLVKMEEAAIMGIEAARASRDKKTGSNIQQKLRGTYFNSAQAKMKNKDYAGAEKCLSKAIEYGNNNSNAHYQLGLALKGQKKWEEAVTSFNNAVEVDMSDDAEKAKIYFELGGAYQTLGDSVKACTSYKKAMFGAFAEASKYQIENVLECDN